MWRTNDSHWMDEDCFLALFLGERAATIPESAKGRLWGTDWSNLHKVQITKEHLTPLCSSLERLDFEDLGDEERIFSIRMVHGVKTLFDRTLQEQFHLRLSSYVIYPNYESLIKNLLIIKTACCTKQFDY